MRPWMALLAVIPACGFSSSSDKTDGSIDTPEVVRCFGSSFTRVCFDSAADVPKAEKTFTGTVTEIDTDSTTVCDQKNDKKSSYCVIAGAGLTVASDQTIRGYGSKPLVLLSTTTIEIHGIIDVSSTSTTVESDAPKKKGAGALASCSGGTEVKANSGGFGGSFQGHGGDGERKDTPDTPIAPAGLTSLPTLLRGGCPGATGATQVVGMTGGAGGDGGGAIALVATGMIHIDGELNASGAGGAGGGILQAGGGGGGSGGMIVLDAPTIVRDGEGALFANGGGGGEGGAAAGAGQAGGISVGPDTAAPGGNGGMDGGNGGLGSSNSDLDGTNALGQSKPGGGGGGGGGAAGFIHAPGVTGDMNIAPPSSPRP